MSVPSFKAILEESEALKKRGDIHFAKNQMTEAIETYDSALRRLSLMAGLPFGELTVARCLSNQAQCFIKLKQFDKAINSINIAFTVPSVAHDTHMLSKLLVRKAIALQSLGYLEQALGCTDRALSLGLASVDEFLTVRNKIIDEILKKDGVVIPIPPQPLPISPEIVNGVITHILLSRGDVEKTRPILESLIKQRAWMDTQDARKNNIMWALCQAAMVKATEPNTNGDVVYPLLELIVVEGEAKCEQRFANAGNKTPLQVFALSGAKHCVELVLSHGASVHILDDDGWSALVVACAPNGPFSGRNSEIVKLLIERKSNVNQRTKTGLSPLSAAAQSKDEESVKLLLEAGASITQRCALGFSPIVWAKIGASVGDNFNAMNMIIEKINALEKESTKYELLQDIRCYDLAQFIAALKIIKKRQLATIGENSINDVDNRLVAFLLSAFVIKPANPDDVFVPHSENENEKVSVYDWLFSSLGQITPAILTKRWQPKPEVHTSFELAINAALPVERCWLKILTSAVRDPDQNTTMDSVLTQNDNHTPPLITYDGMDYYVVSIYQEYQNLVQGPIARLFGLSVPTNGLLEEFALIAKSVCIYTKTYPTNHNPKQGSCNYWKRILSESSMSVEVTDIDKEDTAVILDDTHMCLVPIDNFINESQISLALSDRKELYTHISNRILQLHSRNKCKFVVLGSKVSTDASHLSSGLALLHTELTAILCPLLSASTQLEKIIVLPSWPFQDSYAFVYASS